jgi:hypothetical protein
MQHREGAERGLRDAVDRDQAEAAVERRLDHAALLEDVGEGPVAHQVDEPVALADRGGQIGAHVDRVGDVGLVHVAGIELGPDQRQLRQR